jgi:hypothetical protein
MYHSNNVWMISVAYQYIHVKQTCVTLTYLIYQYLPFVTEKTHVEGHDQHAELDFYSANSPKQYADRHIAPLVHIILIPSQPVFALSQ